MAGEDLSAPPCPNIWPAATAAGTEGVTEVKGGQQRCVHWDERRSCFAICCSFFFFPLVWIGKVEYAFDKWRIYPEKSGPLCRYSCVRMQLQCL